MLKISVVAAFSAILVALCSMASVTQAELIEYPLDQWPDQSVLDISELERLFMTASSLATGSPQRSRELGKCALGSDAAWKLIIPSDNHVTGKFRLAMPATRQDIKLGKIVVYSTPAGCAALPSHINRDVIMPERIHALALSIDFRFPVYIESDYRYTYWIDKYVPIHFRQRYVMDRITTGLKDYPVADRIVSRSTYPGSLHSNVPRHVMNFHGVESGEMELISMQRGQVGLLVANGLYIMQQRDGDLYAYEWYPEGKMLPLRNNRLDGLVKQSQWNAMDASSSADAPLECFANHERMEYFRIIGPYQCEAVSESDAGKPGVYRDRIAVLMEELAREEKEEQQAMAAAGSQHDGSASLPSATPKEAVASVCAKAYAAHRLCQNMPSDPFGVTRSYCVNQIKKNFGGTGCPLPF